MDRRHGLRAIMIAVPLLALALGAAACGSGGKDGGIATAGGAKPAPAGSAAATASADREEAVRQFAQCMRDNGVDVPDPDPNAPGMGFARGGQLDLNNPTFQKALEACRSKLPNGGAPPSLSPEQLDALRAFTQCMRDNGVEVPDPDPNAPFLGLARGGRIDMDNPNFRKAFDACRDKLPFGRGGPGATPSPAG
jgi:hypothetical protein